MNETSDTDRVSSDGNPCRRLCSNKYVRSSVSLMQKLYGIPLLKDNIPFVCFVHTTAQPREIKIRKEMINTIGKFSIWAYNNFNPIELLQVTK